MAPKASKTTKAKSAAQAAQTEADDLRKLQSNMLTQLKSKTATVDQQQMLEYYQSLPRFSELKKELLMKWKTDKTCQWHTGYKATSSHQLETVDSSVDGHGTVYMPQLL